MSVSSTPISRVPQWTTPTLKQGISPAGSSTPLLAAFPGNDDEKERRQRRRSRVIDLQTATDSSFNDSASHSATATPASVPKLSNAQISEHYSTCIKLSTENKITTKNAFGLHLIDYMADILKQKDSELTNFKVAAGTLDASTKIYAVRVDAVHADAYRVLGGLGSETKPGEAPADEEGCEEGEVPASKQAKKKRPPKRTVEQNLANINGTESERKCEVDPMFQRMASSFDESSTAGVFLSVLFSEDSRCELLFPSRLTLLQERPPFSPPPPQLVPSSPFTGGGLRHVLEKSSICPSLKDFSFTDWKPDQTMNQMLEKMQRGEHAFDVNAEPEEDNGGLEPAEDFDADQDEGQGDYGDPALEHIEGCAVSGSGKGRDVIPIGGGDIATMCLQLSSQPREYSYFSPRTMSTWAGPGYWQFKPKHKLDHLPDKETRKRRVKKIFEMDFNEDVNFDTYFRTTRAATTNRKSALSASNRKTTLPTDFQFLPKTLSQLSLKPSAMLHQEGQKRLSGDLGDGIGDYDYNNANDTANFCPALQDSDDDDEGFSISGDAQPLADAGVAPSAQDPEGISTYGEKDLVPEPHRVNKIEINYAKMAKKMDMKRLKNSMWTLLTDGPEKSTEEAQPVETSEVAGEKVFSQTTKSLLQRLPSAMAQNLSIPLAFVALLHLANEKNLELVKVDDMSDIIIKQGQ